MIIGFYEYKIQCIIGELPFERTHEQQILVDLKVEIDFAHKDSLEATVDYTYLADLCRDIAQAGKYHLLETYAHAVLGKILGLDRIISGTITVKKPGAIPGAAQAFVELKR